MAVKIPFIPLQEGYSSVLNESVTGFRTAGGPARLRKSLLGSVTVVNVEWALDQNEYARLVWMIENQLADGTVPFLIDLVLDDSSLSTYTAQIEQSTFVLNEVEGLRYSVGATLLVTRPPVVNVVRDYALISGSAGYLLPDAMQSAMERIV